MFKLKSIKQRISVVMIPLLIYVIAIGVITLALLGTMEKNTTSITRNWMPSISKIDDLIFTTEHIQSLSYSYFLASTSSNPESKAEIAKERTDYIRLLTVTRQAYASLITTDTERQYYNAFSANWEAYFKINTQAMNRSDSNEIDLAYEVLMKGAQSFKDMQKELTSLSAFIQQQADLSAKELESSARTSEMVLLIGIVFILLMTAISTFALIKTLVSPIKQIEQNVKAIAEGDLSVEDIKRDGQDELATLGHGINQMKAALVQIVNRIKNSSEIIGVHSTDLAATSEEVKIGSQQIALSMEESAKAVESQAETAQSSARTVELLNEHIEDHAAKGEQLRGMSELVLGQGTLGKDTMEQSIEQMKQIESRVSISMEQVNKLDQSNENIYQLVHVIRDIAKQTNLLSLNASIEAARAGEHGRGFAVVAEEVRTLSEDVQQAVGQITELTGNIQQESKSVVETLQSGVKETRKGTAQMEAVNDAFNQITTSVHMMVDVIQEISGGLSEMKALSGQMNDFSQMISAVSQQSAASVEEVSASAEEQSGSLEVVAESIQQLTKLSEELLASVSAIRV
ncbi:methyl-accepting chemotaxis protein [Neobacillus mesonae]|nr:methyl-accepting chemotaxis protein [Neobacillus mesonae]